MGLTNPGRALRRSCLLSIFLKLLTLSSILPFSTNSFRLASLLALLVGLNLFFLTGALVWFIKITKVVLCESVEVFHKDPFLALYFSPSSSMIFLLLCLLPSAALYADDLAIWSSSPSVPLAVEATQGTLSNWSAGVFLSIEQMWGLFLPIGPTKLTSSYSTPASVSIQLQLFLGSLSTAFFAFLNVSSLKAKFFPRVKALCCISASSWGPSKKSLSVLYKSFLRSLLTYASSGWLSFFKRYQYHQIGTSPPSG